MFNFKKLFEPTDMTVGTPWKSIVMFSIPLLIGNIAQQLYNTVDSIVVGHYVGDNALAAVGSAGPLFNMLLVLFVGIHLQKKKAFIPVLILPVLHTSRIIRTISRS